MIISQIIQDKYAENYQYLVEIRKRVDETISRFCNEQGYAILAPRIKTVESLAEKIETGRFKNWSEIDDLCAGAIIIPTLADEEEVIAFLRRVFTELHIKVRGSTNLQPENFRFDCTRFIGRISPPPGSEDESNHIFNISFEIQIRTGFEHAWQVALHSVTYKGRNIDWRHLRLAAQLKSSVEQLDMLLLAFKESASFIKEQKWPDIEIQKEILAFFQNQVEINIIPEELTPKDWSRFSNNLFSFFNSCIKDKSRRQEKISNALLKLEEAFKSHAGNNTFPRSISLLQFCIGHLIENRIIVFDGKYCTLITPELESIFPNTSSLTLKFDINN